MTKQTDTPIAILFPHHLFKVSRETLDENLEPNEFPETLCMAAVQTVPGKWYLHQKSAGKSYLQVYDAPFKSAEACVEFAQQTFAGNGATSFERKYEDYELPEPKMKRSELDAMMANFKGTIKICPTGSKTSQKKLESTKAETFFSHVNPKGLKSLKSL